MKTKYLLASPGSGLDLCLNLDTQKLLKLIAVELQKVIVAGPGAKQLPPLKKETLERKKRGGYPAAPMLRTGDLAASLTVQEETGRIVIMVSEDWWKIRRKFHWLKDSDINKAMDRAIKIFMEGIVTIE